MPSRRKLTSADANHVGRSTGVGLSSLACCRPRSFGDASKEVDDARYATATNPEEPGRVFTSILVVDASLSRRPKP
jgi:hypothetical protein